MDLLRKINLAMVSPQKGSYSETFIKAQKELLPFSIFYYYQGNMPRLLEGEGAPVQGGRKVANKYRLNRLLRTDSLKYDEFKLFESFKKNRINVVLAHYGPTGEAIWPVCKALSIPLIVHFHGYDAGINEVISRHNSYRNVFTHASKIISVSKAMNEKLIDLGCPKEKLVYNVYGPDDAFLDLNCSKDTSLFLGVGRFTDKKAPYYTILAFSKVLKVYPDARLVLAGDGPLLNTCKNLVRYMKLEQEIDFPGAISPDAFRKYLGSAVAFVQHSIVAENGDWEGTPVSVLEASAAGLPVISTKHAGIPDVIEDGVTGILVEEHEVEDMADAMMRLLYSPIEARNLGKNGKEKIRSSFSMNRHINELAKIINDLGEGESLPVHS
jgi:colanic acid/amylovoran biosynthesis glycosyltransferase